MDHDFLSSLLDEVALEGLDGITLSMLWIRLQNRSSFSIALDDESKEFLWECVAVHKDIEIYELPAPRKLTPIYNRYEHVDNELGIVLESTEKIFDPYPIAFVKDGDVRGSCSTYHSRICITSEIRRNSTLLLSLAKVNKEWGEKLVLVGSPRLRLFALIGSKVNPLIEFTQEEYCLLERIARSRNLGEVTQGEGGLNKLNAPFCKQIHYYRKNLSSKGLVTKQLHYMKNVKGGITIGSLFHLTRFHVPHTPRLEYLMKCICDLLKEKPLHREQCKIVKEQLNIKDTTFRKLVNGPYQKCVKVFYLPYKEIVSETPKNGKTSIALGRMIQVVQLLKHIDEMNDTDHHGISKEKSKNLSLDVHFDFSKLNYEMPLYQVYEIIQNAGLNGINSLSIGQMLTLPKLEIRSLVELLLKQKLIVSVLQEKGRTKEVIYIDKKLATPTKESFELKVRDLEFSEEKTYDVDVNKRHHKKYNKPVRVSPTDLNDHAVKKIKIDDTVVENVSQDNEGKIECNREETIDKIKSQKKEANVSGKLPKLVSLTEKISPFQVSSCQLTDRKLKRLNMILDHLKAVGSATLLEIHKFLIDREKEENYKFRLDKRSTSRMIHVLFLAKELKIYTAVIKSNEKKVEVELICDKSIDSEDLRVKAAVEQAKLSYFGALSKSVEENKIPVTKTPEKIVGSCKNNEFKRKSSEPLFGEKWMELKMNPKCIRCKTLHEFLFYLVYSYEGHSGDRSNTPVVYHDSMTWKRYVPPLTVGNREGWCFLVDVYNRMPLSVFVKVFNLRHRIQHISEYLNDYEKSHYLLIDLPQSILKTLLDQRVFLFKVEDVLKYLCYMGLISFGPQTGKLKQEVFLYIHKKAFLKDTTKSTPGYMFIDNKLSYEKKVYTLNSLHDVENFWADMEDICLHTPLGKFSPDSKKSTGIIDQRHKPELLKVLKYHNFDEITDLDSIPGDGLGAGGFDSSLFFHYSRNWPSDPGITGKHSRLGLKNPVYMQNLLKHTEITCQKSPSRLQRLHLHAFPKKKNLKTNVENNRSIFLNSLAKKSKKKKNVKSKRMKTSKQKVKNSIVKRKVLRKRIAWHAQEDTFLLLCKVASVFLDPAAKPLVVPYVVVNDLLHDKLPSLSADKTPDACRRRINFIMLNPTTAYNVSIFLEEAKQDKELVKEFDRFKPIKTDAAKDLFSHVVKRLTENITKPVVYKHNKITLPSSTNLFHELYEVVTPSSLLHKKNRHRNPMSEDEVLYCNLYSLILSVFALKQDEAEWSDLLSKLYQLYPGQILKAIVEHLYHENIISYRKYAKEKYPHIDFRSTLPFHFSRTYRNSLFTKFPSVFYKESLELIEILENADPKNSLELDEDAPTGYIVAAMALNSLDLLQLTFQIPEQVIHFDSFSSETQSNVFECMLNNLNEEESVEFFNLISGGKKSPLVNSKDISKPDVTFNKIQQSKNASRIALYLLRQDSSQPTIKNLRTAYDFIALNTCKIFCFPNACFSNITLLRKNAEDDNIPIDSLKSKADILTENCIIKIKDMLTSYIPAKAFEEMNDLELLDKLYGAYSSETLDDAKNILEEVRKSGLLGIEERKLWEKFEHLSGEIFFFEHLQLLRKKMFIIRVGVTSFMYVFICYARNWLLPSNIMPYEENVVRSKENFTNGLNHRSSRNRVIDFGNSDSVQSCNNNMQFEKQKLDFTAPKYFLPRTWRYPDGSLNVLSFIELLQSVLSYVIISPGINISRVTEHFSIALQPVQTLELLEILEKAHCIVKYYCKKLPKRTLFSKPSNTYLTKYPEYDDLEHVEPLPGAVCNLAILQEALIKD